MVETDIVIARSAKTFSPLNNFANGPAPVGYPARICQEVDYSCGPVFTPLFLITIVTPLQYRRMVKQLELAPRAKCLTARPTVDRTADG